MFNKTANSRRTHSNSLFLALLTSLTLSLVASIGGLLSPAMAASNGAPAYETAVSETALKTSTPLLGPINDAYKSDSYILVYGTGCEKAEDNARVREIAEEMGKFLSRMYEETPKSCPVIPDSQFNPSMFGSATILLLAVGSNNSVLNKHYENFPFSVTQGRIAAKDKQFGGRNPGVISIWPQPGKNNGYTVVYLGSTLSAIEECLSNFHGPTDFLVYSDFTKEEGSKWTFTRAGFFAKNSGNWSYSHELSCDSYSAREFFNKWLGWPKTESNCPEASEHRVVFNNGMILYGKFFAADSGRYILKVTRDFKNYSKGQLIMLKGDEIKEVDGCENLNLMIYRPAIANLLQENYTEITPDMEEVSTGYDFYRNESGGIVKKLGFISTPPMTNLSDLFGKRISYTMTRSKEVRLHHYRASLTFPVLPGEDVGDGSHSKKTLDSNIWRRDDGKYGYSLNHFPGPSTFIRRMMKLPNSIELISSTPEPRQILEKDNGKLLIFEWRLDRGEGMYLDMVLEKKN